MKKRASSPSIKPGDLIEIKTKDEILSGIFMPGSNSEKTIIKLKNGYNFGILNKKILQLKKTGTGKKLEIFPSLKLKQNQSLPSVSVIATGGTISSRIDYETGAVSSLMKPGQIFSLAPEIVDIVKIRKIESPFMKLSENMIPDDWKEIAQTTARLINQGDQGVIITHGTDILHYTAAALSFMLKNLTKPVVLTYSQRSTDRGSTDTTLNLICSAYASISDIAEVMLVGHGESSDTFCLANRGTKVRKMHTSMRNTFRPINELPIAKIWPNGNIEIINNSYKKAQEAKGKVIADTKFEEKVALLKYYPGANPEIINYYINKGYKGLVIEATGFGHVCIEGKNSWLSSIEKAITSGLTICFAPQTIYGRLDPYVYSTGRKLFDAGVIYLGDMLPETAYVKLGFVLAHFKNPKDIKQEMLTNYAGELTKKIAPDTFL